MAEVKAIAREGIMKHPRIVETDTKFAIVALAKEADFIVLKSRIASAQLA